METQQLTRSGMPVRRFVAVLVALSAVTWMGTSIYLPGLPLLGRALAMTGRELSTTLTLYYLCFAVLMVLVGPLSDAWGRKGFILTGLLLFLAGSLGCGLAGGKGLFYAGRAAQGMGAAMIQVPTLAMVRDECPGPLAYTVLGLLGALTGVIPVLAMIVGGGLIEWTSWRLVFFLLAAVAAGSAWACLATVPETLPREARRARIDLRGDLATYGRIVFSRQVLLVTAPLLLSAVLQGAYLVAAPYVFQETFGLSPMLFALANLGIVASMAVGQFAATRAIPRLGPRRVYQAGAVLALAGGGLYAGLYGAAVLSGVAAFILPLALFSFSFGVMEPVGLNSLLTTFASTSGMASAVYSSLLLALQGGGSWAGGQLLGAAFSPLATVAVVILPTGLVMAGLAFAGLGLIRGAARG